MSKWAAEFGDVAYQVTMIGTAAVAFILVLKSMASKGWLPAPARNLVAMV